MGKAADTVIKNKNKSAFEYLWMFTMPTQLDKRNKTESPGIKLISTLMYLNHVRNQPTWGVWSCVHDAWRGSGLVICVLNERIHITSAV